MEKNALDSLDPQQKDAATAPLEPCLVIAGSGTGKTTVLVKRFEYLVKNKKFDPKSIVLITLTNKATEEIKKKIFRIFNKNLEFMKKVNVFNFCQFCKYILENEGRNFYICNEIKAVEYVKDIKTTIAIDAEDIAKLIWATRWIENTTNKLVTHEDLVKFEPKFKQEITENFDEFKRICSEYDQALKQDNLLYFDDLLFETNKLLDDEVIRKKWEIKLQTLLFDEFQDIDQVQFEIIRKLFRSKSNIFCLGDPDQAIYDFRRALDKSFERFKKEFPKTLSFELKVNYRSKVNILDVATTLINKGGQNKKLVSNWPEKLGDPVRLLISDNYFDEKEEVLSAVMALHKHKKVPLKKIAILFRAWNSGMELTESLIKKGIPFFSEDPKNVLNREEIRDVLCYLHLASEETITRANKAFLQVINKPDRDFGPKNLKLFKKEANNSRTTLIEYALSRKKTANDWRCDQLWNLIWDIRRMAKSPVDLNHKISMIIERTGLLTYFEKIEPRRLQSIRSFFSLISEIETDSIEKFLNQFKGYSRVTNNKDAIYLSTIHGAKGLEFDYVFVINMHEASLNSIEEERRVFHVAFTRAKKCLFLSASKDTGVISRFIEDVKPFLLEVKSFVDSVNK